MSKSRIYQLDDDELTLKHEDGKLTLLNKDGREAVDISGHIIVRPLVEKIEQLEDELELGKGKLLIDEYVLEEMQERLRFLDALENAGVDNWSGYGYAYELMEEEDE